MNSGAASNSAGDNDWIRRTCLFRSWEQLRAEIELHKWYESEKAGYDIGWERAAVDWMIKYGQRCRDIFRRAREEQT